MNRKPIVLLVNRYSIAGTKRQSMSVRVRLAEPLYYLKDFGKIELLEKDENEITAQDLTSVDLIAVSRSYSQKAVNVMEQAASLKKPILYDVDDDLNVLPKWTTLSDQPIAFENHQRQLSLASLITVPHDLLAQRIKSAHSSVVVIPTAVDFRKFSLSPKEEKQTIVFANLMDLKLETARQAFLCALHDFLQQNPSLSLDVFGDAKSEVCDFPNTNFRGFLPYDEYRKHLSLAGYLFSLSPLGGEEDQEAMRHNECKSPVKYLDYSTAKIPGIYSDCSVYQRVIKQGENGLLTPNTYEGWLNALTMMYQNSELRKKIAFNAFQDVESRFHMNLISENWLQSIKSLAA